MKTILSDIDKLHDHVISDHFTMGLVVGAMFTLLILAIFSKPLKKDDDESI